MKTLYLECNMGAAGDMLTAALAELIPDKKAFAERINSLGIPKVKLSFEPSEKCGICGTHASITIMGEEECEHHHDEHSHHEHHHHHSSSHEIEALIGGLNLSASVKSDALAVFNSILEAESIVHGKPVSEVHLHEVGSLDAAADIISVCLLIEELSPDIIICSPVNTGSGEVHCAHGILPVPAPATEILLRDIPSYSDGTVGELCTPTGAALIKRFASKFGARPALKVEKTGYGMGNKDFLKANCLRAFWGETTDEQSEIVELSCNLDDMTPEDISFACERLFEGGALDVWTSPIVMKKSRMGTLLSCLCKPADREKILPLIFKHTTTLGVRESLKRRYELERKEYTAETENGAVRVKRSSGFGIKREKAEFEDRAEIARQTDKPLSEIKL